MRPCPPAQHPPEAPGHPERTKIRIHRAKCGGCRPGSGTSATLVSDTGQVHGRSGMARLLLVSRQLLLFGSRITGSQPSKRDSSQQHDQRGRHEPGNVQENARESQDGAKEERPNPPIEQGSTSPRRVKQRQKHFRPARCAWTTTHGYTLQPPRSESRDRTGALLLPP